MNAVTAEQIKNSADLRVRDLSTSLLVRGGLLALALAVTICWYAEPDMSRLLHAYLLNICFFLSISLGALFFVVVQHLTGARWGVVTRRLAELLTSTIPLLGLLMLPILAMLLWGNAELYSWNSVAELDKDALLQGKAPYLNAPFFVLRCLGCFAVWIVIARFYSKQSLAQDTASDGVAAAKMRKWSGPAMLAFAATINIAAFDWIMSLDYHWFSTIFGVYYFSGCAVAVFAALPIMLATLQRYGFVRQAITTEHYHDLGKLLYGFMLFWAYIAFSQFLLIWYANIPEETEWFLHRQEHGWQVVGLLLILGHFLLPLFGLMSRHVRRNRQALIFWCVFLLVMHWIDLYWQILPNVSQQQVVLGLPEILTLLGVGALWLAAFLKKMAGTPLVPIGDPDLGTSLSFHNV